MRVVGSGGIGERAVVDGFCQGGVSRQGDGGVFQCLHALEPDRA